MILYARDYESTLREELVHNLNWLEEEFSFLFNSKKHKFSQEEKALANQIIDNISDCVRSLRDLELNELLTSTVNSIRSIYPALF